MLGNTETVNISDYKEIDKFISNKYSNRNGYVYFYWKFIMLKSKKISFTDEEKEKITNDYSKIKNHSQIKKRLFNYIDTLNLFDSIPIKGTFKNDTYMLFKSISAYPENFYLQEIKEFFEKEREKEKERERENKKSDILKIYFFYNLDANFINYNLLEEIFKIFLNFKETRIMFVTNYKHRKLFDILNQIDGLWRLNFKLIYAKVEETFYHSNIIIQYKKRRWKLFKYDANAKIFIFPIDYEKSVVSSYIRKFYSHHEKRFISLEKTKTADTLQITYKNYGIDEDESIKIIKHIQNYLNDKTNKNLKIKRDELLFELNLFYIKSGIKEILFVQSVVWLIFHIKKINNSENAKKILWEIQESKLLTEIIEGFSNLLIDDTLLPKISEEELPKIMQKLHLEPFGKEKLIFSTLFQELSFYSDCKNVRKNFFSIIYNSEYRKRLFKHKGEKNYKEFTTEKAAAYIKESFYL